MPFHPKILSAFASHSKARPKYSNILARIDNGHVPNSTTRTIIIIVSSIPFIEAPFVMP